MKILAVGYLYEYLDKPVPSYFRSIIERLKEKGYEVDILSPKEYTLEKTKDYDYLFNMDTGRDKEGTHSLITEKPLIPSFIYLIDSHGNPSLHRRTAKLFDHVFFAVWAQRDLFEAHPSAHWRPNFTDLKWFDRNKYKDSTLEFDFGFFGSRGGLDRANPMIDVCEKNGWSYDVRQICPPNKHMWPSTPEAMSKCRFLFNHQQKHDGPNLRVIESMAMGKCLITDVDPFSGMDKLFIENFHYVGYESYTYNGLEAAMKIAMEHPNVTDEIADNGYHQVVTHHLVEHRVDEMLEVILA